MIRLGLLDDFKYVISAGALGFDGRGYWWERPWYWRRKLQAHKFLVITKTVTRHPNAGNYRWYKPWDTFRFLPGKSTVNALGLPNPGIVGWFKRYYNRVEADRNAGRIGGICLSIAPKTPAEANEMAWTARSRDFGLIIRAIEINCSCPNVPHDDQAEHIDATVEAARIPGIPLIVKLGYTQDVLKIVERVQGRVAAVDLINAVPWHAFNGALGDSPLARHGGGGVSGDAIGFYATRTLLKVKRAFPRVPCISAGGVRSRDQVLARFDIGADAVGFGTVVMTDPGAPARIVNEIDDPKSKTFSI